jgi:hypothetical protein|tara:strand:- start:45 stop:3638 length:3594 start_codon:yes stop_codon:yes gene_type:complete
MAAPDLTLDFLLSGLSGAADSPGDEPGDPNDPAGDDRYQSQLDLINQSVGTQESVATDINAELAQMLARGIDPRTRFKQEAGLLGKSDVFSYETEKGFSPKVREFVRRFYGPTEIQYRPDAWFSNPWRRMFGSAPTDEEKIQIAQAQQLAARGSGSASAAYRRAMEEVHRGTPSAAEVRGEIPPDIDLPPWLQPYAEKGRRIELPEHQAKVLLRDSGIVQGSDVDQEVIKTARIAANSINQLEGISPGLAKNTLGPILAEDFNVHFGLKGTDDEVTAESLNIRAVDFQGTQKLIYTHPETGQETLFDPVKLELRDIAEVLPELMVIGGDVIGMGLGTGLGAVAGPKGALAGNVMGGAIGAVYGRMTGYRMALAKNNFAFDERYGGFVKEGYNDEAGNPIVIPESDLFLNAIPDAYWSAGGNVFLRGIFKLGKVALYGPQTGRDALQGGLTVEEFEQAVQSYKRTFLGQQSYGPWGLKEGRPPPPTSVVLQKAGEDLIEKSRTSGVGAQDRTNMFELGQKYLQQADVLRYAEAGTPAATAREILKEETIKEGEGAAALEARQVISARSEDVALAVQKGLPVDATREVTKELNEIIARNAASIDEINRILGRGTETSSTELGAILAAKTKAIMGDPSPTGTTGVYGVYNRLVEILGKPAFTKGVPLKPFEISGVSRDIAKLQQSSGALGGGFPGEFLGDWKAMIGRVGSKKGVAQGTINVDYKQMRDLVLSLRNDLGSNGNLNQTQRENMGEILKQLEAIQVRGLQAIDDAGAAAGKPTSFARQQQSADEHLGNLAEIWQRGFTQGLEDGTFHRIADRLFEKGAAPGFIGKVMSTIKPNKKQLELMRNTLLYRYKQAMEGLARGEVQAGADIAGQRVRIGMGADDLVIRRADQAVHNKFLTENDSWIKVLFKDGEFDKLTHEVTNVTKQQVDAEKLIKFDKQLRENPIFGKGMLSIREDLGKVIIEAPESLVDEIFKLPPGQRNTSFKFLYKSLKGLPKTERLLARRNMRGLLFRKLLRPEELMTAGRDEAIDAYRVSSHASAHIKENASVYDLVFGKSHRQALEQIFRDIGTLSRTGSAPALEGWLKQPTTKIPLAALKVYVGVLNKRARALTQGQNRFAEGLDRRFREALLDPDKALKLVKGRNISTRTKYGINFLGQILGIEAGEAVDAVNTFGIDSEQYPGVRKATLTGVGLGVE